MLRYPVNTRMNDIKNQIAFITEGDNSALPVLVDNIELILAKAQQIFNRWSQLLMKNVPPKFC